VLPDKLAPLVRASRERGILIVATLFTLVPGRARLFAGRLLVIGQFACSVTLVIGATLLLRTLTVHVTDWPGLAGSGTATRFTVNPDPQPHRRPSPSSRGKTLASPKANGSA
jgi:hypothetical protein